MKCLGGGGISVALGSIGSPFAMFGWEGGDGPDVGVESDPVVCGYSHLYHLTTFAAHVYPVPAEISRM